MLHKMFRAIKKILALIFLVSNVNSLKCVLMKNQECKVRELIKNNDYMLYPFSIKVNRCNGNCKISAIHIPECVFQILLKI